ncbi:MAG: aminotransferase class I/II-fold pyridoxal phosphate-dependent enzyme [Verrucomicrobiota bacterium]
MTSKPSRIFLSPPHMGGAEQTYVAEAFNANYIAPVGPQLDKFEDDFKRFTGFKHAVAVTSGTAAIHLALHHLGVERGDLVMASSLTFIGSVGPAFHLGAELRFVDSDPDNWTMSPRLLEEAIKDCALEGRMPKVVIPTDLYGQSCDVESLKRICDAHEIPLLVDSAEALGASYKNRHAGLGSYAAAFSFNGNKIITTSGGGILASDDGDVVEHARKLSTQAREPFIHFEHQEVGYNFRMSNVTAAIGIGQLEVLVERVMRKREIFKAYQVELGSVQGIELMPLAPYGESNCWLTVVLIDEKEFGASREEVMIALESENIESRPMWKPMHLQPVFSGCRVYGGLVAESLYKDGLCLPSGTAMTEENITRVCEVVLGTPDTAPK